MKHGLCGVELGDRWEHTTSIAGEEDDIAGVICGNTWDLGVVNILNGVGATSIFCKSCVIVINKTSFWAEDNVFEDRTKLDGVEDIWFLLCRETHTLCVALQKLV